MSESAIIFDVSHASFSAICNQVVAGAETASCLPCSAVSHEEVEPLNWLPDQTTEASFVSLRCNMQVAETRGCHFT